MSFGNRVWLAIVLASLFGIQFRDARAGFSAACFGAAAIETARQATVTVRIPGRDGEDETVGAGFLESRTGKFVTNAHVIGEAETVRIGTSDGRVAAARIVGRDRRLDIAVLAADLPGVPSLRFARDTPAVGAPVYAVGSPFGLGQSVTRGVVSAHDRAIDPTTPYGMIQHDAPLNPGSSGGPVIDASGRVIGINAAMPDGFRRDVGVAYAIPAAVAERAVVALASGVPAVERPLGVSLRALTPRLAATLGVPADSGVLVEAVDPGSAAEAAGIRPSDVLLTVAGQPIVALRDVAVALDRADPAARIAVALLRGAEVVTVTLPEATPEPPSKLKPALPGLDRAPVAATALGFAWGGSGAPVIAEIARPSPASVAGLARGETILAVGRTPVSTSADARRLIGERVSAPFALLVADTDGQTRYLVIDPWASGLDGDGLGGNMRHPRSARF